MNHHPFFHKIFDSGVSVHESNCMAHVEIKLQTRILKQSLETILSRNVCIYIVDKFERWLSAIEDMRQSQLLVG